MNFEFQVNENYLQLNSQEFKLNIYQQENDQFQNETQENPIITNNQGDKGYAFSQDSQLQKDYNLEVNKEIQPNLKITNSQGDKYNGFSQNSYKQQQAFYQKQLNESSEIANSHDNIIYGLNENSQLLKNCIIGTIKEIQLNSKTTNSQGDDCFIQNSQKQNERLNESSESFNSQGDKVDGIYQNFYAVKIYNLETLNKEEREMGQQLINFLINKQLGENRKLTYTLIEQLYKFYKVKNYKIIDYLDVRGQDVFFTATKIEKDGSDDNAVIQFIQQEKINDQNIQILKSLETKQYFIKMIDQEQIDDIQVLILQSCNSIEWLIKNKKEIEKIKIILNLLQRFIILEIKEMFHLSKKPLNIFIDDHNKRLYFNINAPEINNQAVEENFSNPSPILEDLKEQQGNQNNNSCRLTFQFNLQYLKDILLDITESKQLENNDFMNFITILYEKMVELVNQENSIVNYFLKLFDKLNQQINQNATYFNEVKDLFQGLFKEILEQSKNTKLENEIQSSLSQREFFNLNEIAKQKQE
ncbi:hypothetical protein ABPG74_019941 [Tetrahymena malaccensis]